MKKIIALMFVVILGFTVLAYGAFEQQQSVSKNPQEIRNVEVVLFRTIKDGIVEAGQSIGYSIAVNDQFGETMKHYRGDLIPHLTTAQKDQLIAFMDMLWQKAEDEILP